jgi:atypical dual specificity phosphatase
MSDWFERYWFAEVADGLLTGAQPLDAEDAARLREAGVTAVYSLCSEDEYADGELEAAIEALRAAGLTLGGVPTKDFGNLLPGLLERASEDVAELLDEGQCVYVHCRAGWQRSTVVAAAVLARRDGTSPAEALRAIRRRKRDAEPLPHQVEDLERWWAARRARGDAGA